MEDYDMLLRLYANGCYGSNVEDILYYIRRDENQYKRRKYRYRWNEAKMKYQGFSSLGLMPKGMIYVIKPLIVGLIPWRVSAILQKKYYRKLAEENGLMISCGSDFHGEMIKPNVNFGMELADEYVPMLVRKN